MSISAVARALGLGWDLVNNLAVEAARTLVYDDPTHLEGVRILGVDEHKWKHVRGGGEDSYVTILVDLTPTIQGTGPARQIGRASCRERVGVSVGEGVVDEKVGEW